MRVGHIIIAAALVMAMVASTIPARAAAADPKGAGVSILVYHRFGPTVADSMTTRTAIFAQQLAWLEAHGYRIVPLRDVLGRLHAGQSPADGPSIVMTVDDGHRSVYTELFPLIQKYRFPVTLFIYPSAISNASYAMTWEQLAEMSRSGLVDVQSHTLWHPNFHREKKRLDDARYHDFVATQLRRSKEIIASRLGRPVDVLAWPFGIYDIGLEQAARDAGYAAALSIDRGPVSVGSDFFHLPRYLMADGDQGPRFAAIAEGRGR